MGQYIAAFSFYTLAMIGIIFVAFLVYKKVILTSDNKKSSSLKIEDMLRLSSRKVLYVIKAADERFLIASDMENTTFLAKLNQKTDLKCIDPQNFETKEIFTEDEEISSEIAKKSVMRNILEELNTKTKGGV